MTGIEPSALYRVWTTAADGRFGMVRGVPPTEREVGVATGPARLNPARGLRLVTEIADEVGGRGTAAVVGEGLGTEARSAP